MGQEIYEIPLNYSSSNRAEWRKKRTTTKPWKMTRGWLTGIRRKYFVKSYPIVTLIDIKLIAACRTIGDQMLPLRS